MWNKVVRRVTQMSIKKDLQPAYLAMCTIVDQKELNGYLASNAILFPKLPLAATPRE